MLNRSHSINADAEGDFLFKAIIIGDAGVGKSCILLRYTKQEFVNDYNVTIGVDFSTKSVELDKYTTVKLQIWDTAGQETFGTIIKKFFRHAAIVFLVYDVNRRDTFENIETWLENARGSCEESAIFVLMGNKADRGEDKREVRFHEGETFMERNGISFFFETSALNGDNVDKAFNEATKLAFLQYVKENVGKAPQQPEQEKEKAKVVHIVPQKTGPAAPVKNDGCC